MLFIRNWFNVVREQWKFHLNTETFVVPVLIIVVRSFPISLFCRFKFDLDLLNY